MGNSVIFAPAGNSGVVNAHMEVVRDRLGKGKREGPFSGNGAVAQIADHVRSRLGSSGHGVLGTAMRTIWPQDVIPERFSTSRLEIPFILSDAPAEIPESAEAVASAPTVAFRNGKGRPADIAALTMLTVAVLRRLDMECHFAVYNSSTGPFEDMITDLGARFVASAVPIVIAPNGTEPLMGSVIPNPFEFPLGSKPRSFEVLDADALLSLIKLRNAFGRATKLMGEMADGAPEADRTPEAIRIGHMLHEGRTLWTTKQALESTTGSCGTDEQSVRLAVEDSIVHGMTCPTGRTTLAIALMLHDAETLRRLHGLIELAPDGIGAMRFVDALPDTRDFHPLKEYLRLSVIMNEHLHPECKP